MSHPIDQAARDRFAGELDRNFAVNANAGSGKTTSIARRLAALSLAGNAGEVLPRTVVVTFTRKAALEIKQRARLELMSQLTRDARRGAGAMEHLGRAFFGTIHSFCLLLARRYGQPLGVDLDPEVIEDASDEALWEEFLEQDRMIFESVEQGDLAKFLRFRPLDTVFSLAQSLSVRAGRLLLAVERNLPEPEPDWNELQTLLERKPSRKGKAAENLEANQRALDRWGQAFREEVGFLPLIKPNGKANGVVESFDAFYAPLKDWCAGVAGRLSAELADRYRGFRQDRRIQTFADQVELAMRLVEHPELLDRIRRDGYRILLDEAQDTDPAQFSVLVETARPVGAIPGTWPGEGEPPESGRFCLVGDAQQSIYGGRADIRNYQSHLGAFREGSGGEVLDFTVTFRLPERVIGFMNQVVAPGFSPLITHNQSVDGDCLQVPYLPLSPRPEVLEGRVSRLKYSEAGFGKVADRLRAEVRALASVLKQLGPEGVGAKDWSEVCILAPRREWLEVARECLEAAGLSGSLQTRASRNGDRPGYAWVAGLLSVIVDPENGFEWVGVLRDIFGVSDALLADHLDGEAPEFGSPERYPGEIRLPMEVIRPFVLGCDEAGVEPVRFLDRLIGACALKKRMEVLEVAEEGFEDLEAIRFVADEVSNRGGGIRELQTRLIREIDRETPSGQTGRGSINLLTCHSGKGLEWTVVIPIGLWRPLARPNESGFSFIDDRQAPKVFFDRARVPGKTMDSRERELIREHMRLLYVTLSRGSGHLILPLPDGMEGDKASFLSVWSGGEADRLNDALRLLPELTVADQAERLVDEEVAETRFTVESPGRMELARAVASSLGAPRRRLPHQMAKSPDLVRTLLHEAGAEANELEGDSSDPIEYGLWWHETMEFMPWSDGSAVIDSYLKERLNKAREASYLKRAGKELDRFLSSPLWASLRESDLTLFSEVAVFSPGEVGEWIDGVLDLLVLDRDGSPLMVVDWKTNRLRRGETEEALSGRLLTTYQPQLEAYVRAIEKGLRRGAPSGLVYSTASGRSIPVP